MSKNGARTAERTRVGARRYGALWSRKTSLQREFALFGGEFLMTLDAEALRGWFGGFFALDQDARRPARPFEKNRPFEDARKTPLRDARGAVARSPVVVASFRDARGVGARARAASTPFGAERRRRRFGADRSVSQVWAGFLAGWPGLRGNEHHETRWKRLVFGLSLLPRPLSQLPSPLPLVSLLA